MPRPIAPPYSNVADQLRVDHAKLKRFSFANASFLNIHNRRNSDSKSFATQSKHESSSVGNDSPKSSAGDSMQAIIASRWNQRFQSGVKDRASPLSRMNVGTSYFVAATNITHKPEIVKVVE
jgi:hypothetical protein